MNLEPVNYFHIFLLIFLTIVGIWLRIEGKNIDKIVEPNRTRPRKDIRQWDIQQTKKHYMK